MNFKKQNLLLLALFCLSINPMYSYTMNNANMQENQRKHITGVVEDSNGSPLIGANVIEKGTSNGTITDLNGKYSLYVYDNATLQVSYIGFLSQTLKVKNNKIYNIKLEEDARSLNEVVVVGYGQMKKSDVTGSLASIAIDRNKATVSTDVNQLLQGNAAGVYVNSNSSIPGSLINVRIRGTATLNGGKEPLYVVDGVIMNDATEDNSNVMSRGSGADPVQSAQSGLTGINPQDIKSIEVLKDASATAIYGSRASNGVVLITTKEGRNGKTQINLNMGFDFGKPNKYMDVLNANDYIQYINEKTPGTYASDYNPETRDWQRELTRTANTQSYRLTINGGNNTLNYYLAGGYIKNNSLIKNSGLNQYDLKTKFKYNLTNRLSLAGNYYVLCRKNDMTTGTDGLGNPNSSLARQMILHKPFYANNSEDDDTEDMFTPDNWLTDYRDYSQEKRNVLSLSADYSIIKGLTFHLMGSYDNRNKDRSRWYANGTYTGYHVNGQLGIQNMESEKYGIEALLYYDYVIKKLHHISGTLGITYDKRKVSRTGMLGENFSIQTLGIYGISYAGTTYTNTSLYTNEATASSLLRLNYSFTDRYLLTLTGRIDGSSKFQKDNRYSFFPSVAIAWRINNENWLKDVKWLSNTKLRLGWGQTGNQSISPFATQITYGSVYYSSATGSNIIGLAPSQIANPDLKWETTDQTNVGLDLGFFDNRITVSFDWYNKKTKDILQSMNAPSSTGFGSLYVNRGTIRNTGEEFSINAVPIITKDLTWSIGCNISFNKNKILDLGLPEAKYGTETYQAYYGSNLSYYGYTAFPVNIFIAGKPIGLFWGYKTKGIFQSDEEANGLKYNGAKLGAGDIAYVDMNGDNVITTDDRTIIGNPNPDFTFGFNTSLKYKYFTIAAQFYGSYGNDIVNANLLENTSTYLENNILKDAYYNAWRSDKPSNLYPKLGTPLKEMTDRYIKNGSFVRLSSLSVTYDVPIKIKKVISGIQLSVIGRNLFTITNYDGYNPDVNSFSNDPTRIGIDYGSFPILRSYSLGVNIIF